MSGLVERLRAAGSQGADLSPGDPLCAEAAKELERLARERDGWRREYVAYGRRLQHAYDLNAQAMEALRTVARGRDPSDYGMLGATVARLMAVAADVFESKPEPYAFPSAHVTLVPWCACCECRVDADHVCGCEAGEWEPVE